MILQDRVKVKLDYIRTCQNPSSFLFSFSRKD